MSGSETKPEAWLAKADEDLLAVRNLLAATEVPWSIVCFHSQQAAEKYLKAFIVSSGTKPEYIHDLIRLLKVCTMTDPSVAVLEADCRSLNSYAADVRYPDLEEEATEVMARDALGAAQRICDTIRQRLPKP